jgi:hypothetical protein
VYGNAICELRKIASRKNLISLLNSTSTRTHNLKKCRLVTKALEIEAKADYRRMFENPCVGGSIPPRATKNLNSPLDGLFFFWGLGRIKRH